MDCHTAHIACKFNEIKEKVDCRTGKIPKWVKKRTGEIIIEEKYTKQGLYESILERPTLYIGSVEPVTEWMWVYNEDKEQMEKREIKYSPGLLKIFDEILVNASDHKKTDETMDEIRITIDKEKNEITVRNNGKGIEVAIHQTEKVYVPTMIADYL